MQVGTVEKVSKILSVNPFVAGMIVGSKSGIQAGIGKVFAATKGGVFLGEIFRTLWDGDRFGSDLRSEGSD